MAEMSLAEAASHLGAVYSALIHEKLGPLSGEDLPGWMTPIRKRLPPFRLKPVSEPDYRIRRALALGLYPDVATERPVELRRAMYDNCLRIFLPACRSALFSETNERLLRQMIELELLKRRFNRPGADDQLHESAKRIWNPTLPGADSEPPPAKPANEPPSQSEAETLPGGATKSSESREKNSFYETVESYHMPPYMGRQKLLAAIKKERDALETQGADSPEAQGSRAQHHEAKQISVLLAAIAVLPEAERIIRLYAESPLKGTELILLEIKKAYDATNELHNRLTAPENRDDAWGYAPLVVGAVTRLGLHEVHGLPEFAVAMGQLLKQTDTKTILSAASLLMISLSIAFSGGAGAVVVGALDLALSGTSAGIVLLRIHEQEIAATATTFNPEKKLADHPDASDVGEAGLEIACAFLSAISLVGAIKGVVKVTPKQLLSTRPRPPEVLKPNKKLHSFSSKEPSAEAWEKAAAKRKSFTLNSKGVELRKPLKITSRASWSNGIVPFRTRSMFFDVQGFHFVVINLNAFEILLFN